VRLGLGEPPGLVVLDGEGEGLWDREHGRASEMMENSPRCKKAMRLHPAASDDPPEQRPQLLLGRSYENPSS
jgi:hypothetical protein